MSWSILIPTLGQRSELFKRLITVLLPQTEQYNGAVKVVAWYNHGRPSLADIRQRLVQTADTEYVSFIDDDDLVPEYYVSEVMTALASRPDYVGWQVECFEDDTLVAIAYHSLKYTRWEDTETGLYRDISHLNPVRTQLARQADFRFKRPDFPEDRAWVAQMRGKLRTEVMIDKVMYHYMWSESVSAWRDPHKIKTMGERPVIDHPFFSWHEEST